MHWKIFLSCCNFASTVLKSYCPRVCKSKLPVKTETSRFRKVFMFQEFNKNFIRKPHISKRLCFVPWRVYFTYFRLGLAGGLCSCQCLRSLWVPGHCSWVTCPGAANKCGTFRLSMSVSLLITSSPFDLGFGHGKLKSLMKFSSAEGFDVWIWCFQSTFQILFVYLEMPKILMGLESYIIKR